MNSNYYPPQTDLRFINTTHEEERELFRRMHKGDSAARETLIRNHLLFVSIVARKSACGRFSDDDVVSAANEALMKAVDNKQFDFERGNRFTSYLRPFVRGAISKMWKDAAKYVPLPENAEAPVPGALPQGPETSVEHPSESTDFQDFVHSALESGKAKLTEREQLILSLMYEQGLNGAEVGRRLRMTRERVRQIHVEILEKLKRALKKNGIENR